MPRPVARRTAPPQLVVSIPLECHGRIVLDSATREDELRLREWLRRASVFEDLPEILARLLDDLDRLDGLGAKPA